MASRAVAALCVMSPTLFLSASGYRVGPMPLLRKISDGPEFWPSRRSVTHRLQRRSQDAYDLHPTT